MPSNGCFNTEDNNRSGTAYIDPGSSLLYLLEESCRGRAALFLFVDEFLSFKNLIANCSNSRALLSVVIPYAKYIASSMLNHSLSYCQLFFLPFAFSRKAKERTSSYQYDREWFNINEAMYLAYGITNYN